ncbi:RCC1/BLIP-II [Glarea lozoyensis ATCC 20868]|uniref:RCC1/BLIP-II n=1 Tax=Glarea lozoyensis (strain ATCC 20868 / MF5171) TaxID=1116229 RepID=S3D7Y8_GLAL2|nr:RCC1/BLIP-II [Glarea lozoyensis ATCC 20868]EPE34622.1 RCC1/BLIP-II [Glarea lozoyensis ATCC 20868]
MTTLFAIGSNGSGQLGIGHKEDVSVPKQVHFQNETPSSTPQVRAGGNHTLLLSSGRLFCSGDISSGACGLVSEPENDDSGFREVRLDTEESSTRHDSTICFCAATWEATTIVLKDERGKATKVYSFGTGNKGELGQGELLFRSSKAQLIKEFPPDGLEVVDLAASVSHVVIVLENGDVYGWGNGRKGQLGKPDAIVHIPRKLGGINFKVVRAVCGREFTYLLSDCTAGEHVVLGSNKWEVISSAPLHVPGWKDVGASWGSIFVLQEDGILLSWGRDDHGQLSPPGLPPLSQVAIGSEHALGHALDGRVLAWGWGEHGNCGPNTEHGDVKGRWNVIASSQYLPPSARMSGIGAGCATSWVCIVA